jgi:hypothetical protein
MICPVCDLGTVGTGNASFWSSYGLGLMGQRRFQLDKQSAHFGKQKREPRLNRPVAPSQQQETGA